MVGRESWSRRRAARALLLPATPAAGTATTAATLPLASQALKHLDNTLANVRLSKQYRWIGVRDLGDNIRGSRTACIDSEDDQRRRDQRALTHTGRDQGQSFDAPMI